MEIEQSEAINENGDEEIAKENKWVLYKYTRWKIN